MTLKECALAYVRDLKWSIFPCAPRTKKPLIKWGPYQNRLPTLDEIEKWWTKWPQANIGVVCGKISGIICVDIDSPEAQESYRAEYGEIHNTIRQTTGKPGGLHLVFNYPLDGNFYRNVGDVNKESSTIEIHCRGDGGFFVAAPSIHPNGTQYNWVLDPLESPDDILDLPEDVKSLWGYKPKTAKKVTEKKTAGAMTGKAPFDLAKLLEGADEPGYPGAGANGRLLGRDIQCTRICGHWLNYNPPEDVRIMLYGWNLLCNPPFPNDQSDKVWKSIVDRRGLEGLAESPNGGVTITDIDILKYPDGSFVYKVYIAPREESTEKSWTTMKPDELAGQTGCRIKLMNITKVLIPPVKAKVWADKITAALANAKEVIMEEDESIIGEIRHKIWQAVSSYIDYPDEPDPAGKISQGEIVLHKGLVYFNSTAMYNRFMNTKEVIKRRELHDYLSRLAGKKQTHRLEDKTVKSWCVGIDDIRPKN